MGEERANSETFGDGIPFVAWVLLWLLGAVMAITLTGIDVVFPVIDRMIGRDFTNLWIGGKLALAGHASCAFDVNCFRLDMYRELGLLGLQNYSYPPMVLLLDAPFALLPYYWALALWTALGIAFFVWCARPFLPKGFPPILVALTPAATINIWNGHYGFLLGGLWLLTFRDIETKPARAGIFAGLLTFKPHLGLMIAATVVRRRWALLAAIAAVVVLVVVSSLVLGPWTWGDFFTGTTAEQTHVLTRSSSEFYFRMMPSAYVGYGKGIIGVTAQILFALAAIALLARSGKWDAFSASTATFLIVPYAFNYDMTVACLGFVLLLFERWSSLSRVERGVIALAFFSPELTYYAGFAVPPILLAALYLQLKGAPVTVQSARAADQQPQPATPSLPADMAAT
jgi:hypothetical protein